MEPIYFGGTERALFGIFHPSSAPARRGCGVVVCAPIGQEQIRAQRALMNLARRLAGAGFDVLRFDYMGCGDSVGRCEDGTVSRWIDDIGTAIDELRDGSGVSRIGLVGVRLGATLGALAGAKRGDVHYLVGWDPVLQGASYLSELRSHHDEWQRGSFARREEGPHRQPEILGFPLAESLAAELRSLDLQEIAREPAPDLFWIDSGADHSANPFLKRLSELGTRARHLLIPAPPIWIKLKDGDELGGGTVPIPILNEIVTWMSTVDA